MNQRRLLIGLIIVTFSLAAFLGAYLINQSKLSLNVPLLKTGSILNKFDQEVALNSSDNSIASSNKEGMLSQLGSKKAISATTTSDGNGVIYYEKGTGKVFEVNLEDRSEKMVSQIVLPNFVNTIWSPNKKEVVSLYYVPAGNQYKYFNYDTKKSIPLDNRIVSLAFSPDGTELAFFKKGSDDEIGLNKIFISQPDATSYKEIFKTRNNDVIIDWPNKDFLSLKSKDPYDMWSLFALKTDGILEKIIDFKSNLEDKWSPDGSRDLISYINEDESTGIIVYDFKTKAERQIKLNTRASRCAWSINNTTIICVASRSQNLSQEDFYMIDLTKNEDPKIIASPDGTIKTEEIFLSQLENYIIIKNAFDERLYSIKIKGL